jgi:hypothetical protein
MHRDLIRTGAVASTARPANRTAETRRISSSRTSGGKFSLEANSATKGRNSVELSKAICQPDHEFESCLVRQQLSY